ncbi:cytochrome c biogenesis protein ResB [Geobacter sp.]|uniref:cytochrome c biogenesis protein ResB n=1 Tax=Geobacter sp. TaxID=46610 RepID=UPI00262C5D95|nr:cytochrome c biogenesis protein ResB [Geobacter sp.]
MDEAKKITPEKVVRFLGGLKLSFFLLTLLGLLAAQKAILAQSALQEDAPRFLRMLMSLKGLSPDVLGVLLVAGLGLFVVNLLFSSVRMFRKVRTRQKAFACFRGRDAIAGMTNREEFNASTDPTAKLVDYFRQRGFTVAVERNGGNVLLHAGKRLTGLWGIFFFHMTFMILLFGILLSMLTGFAGYVALSPGDLFVEKRSAYMRATDRPLLFGSDRFFKVRLDSIDLSYWRPGEVRQRSSTVSLFAPDGRFLAQRRMEINQPITIGDTAVYQGTRQGFAAELLVTDRAGTTVKATARFLFPAKSGDSLTCVLPLPGTDVNLLMELVTDQVRTIPGLESLAPAHPATLIKLRTVEHGPPVFRGVMFPGTGLIFEGLKVGFVKLKPFSSIVVKRDYGVPVIFASFASLVLGLLIAYYWVPENWWVACEREGERYRLTAGATVERYRESFGGRFAAQVKEIRAEVGEG